MLGFLSSIGDRRNIDQDKKTAEVLDNMVLTLKKSSQELARKQKCSAKALNHLYDSLKLLDKDSTEWKYTFKAVQALADSVTESTMEPFDLRPYENAYRIKKDKDIKDNTKENKE